MDFKLYIGQLNTRERYMLLLAGIVLVFYIFYALVYSPLANSVSKKQVILSENKQTLLWMENVYDKYHNIQQSEVLSSDKLLSILSTQLKNSNLQDFNYQIEQTSTGDIRLSFSQVSYNDFMQWLWKFCGKYTLIIKQFTAVAKGSPGVVKVNVIISQD